MREANERGAAAVEFALVVTLLFLILFAILDGGRLWMIQSSLSHAAREGAREMAITGNQVAAQSVIETYPILGAVGADAVVTPATCTSGATVVAEARYEANTLTGLTFDMAGRAEMRCGG